jgi:surface polysaccharide O-acyltransferase-like enzyme
MGGLADYFSQFIEVKGWLLLLFFNQSFSAYRLWFILALIYVYVLQILIHKAKISYRAVAILSVCAVVLHIFFGAIPAALGFEPQEYFCRNYLLFGFPFFGFGLFMRHHQDKFSNLSPVMLTACLILGCILSPSLMMYQTGSQISIGSLLIAFSIFCYALKHSTVTYSAWVIQLTQCSLGIYIFHRPVSTIVRKSFSLFGLIRHPILCDIIGPILVCIFSTILTLALKQLQKKHQAASRKS